jgi:protein gp37
MSESTAISWCDSTFNPWMGCTKVSPACDHCYAEALVDGRFGKARWGAGQPRVRTSAANWKLPLKWARRAFVECPSTACGWRGMHTQLQHTAGGHRCPQCGNDEWRPARMRVFCASLADVFDNEAPREWLADLLDTIRRTPELDWLLLTKRIGNVERMLLDAGQAAAADGDMLNASTVLPPNVWLGATICDQAEADRDIPKLLAVPARVRFLSIEPMLGPVDLTRIVLHSGPIDLAATAPPQWRNVKTVNVVRNALKPGKQSGTRIDWVICGGESGPKARPMNPDWARSLRDQCAAAGVPFHFKQWGEWGPRPVGRVHDSHRWPIQPGEPPGGVWSYRCTGLSRRLDGLEHNGFPA